FENDYDFEFSPDLPTTLIPSRIYKDILFSTIGFQLSFKYRPNEALLIYYLPAFILVVISNLSFLIAVDGAPARISLVTLSLLALVNQFNSLNGVAPKGGKGPTAAAIYLLTCVFSNCFCLGLNILSFRFKKDSLMFKRVNLYTGLTSSLSFLLFNIIYWPVIASAI
ncbi:uncharacterized protein LOC111717505, partial [Eurytemora carolleeae]|uniref:uncharacterized protein LOC111717505 n=1 Tax=Eurytemora carolleeae TaxID=1294199 RepID=UPI000C769CA3